MTHPSAPKPLPNLAARADYRRGASSPCSSSPRSCARASARSEDACAAGPYAVRAPVQATPQWTSVRYPDRARPSARYNSGPANSARPTSHIKSHPAKAEPRLVATAPPQPTVERLQPTASKGPNTNGTARIEQIAAAPQSTPSRRDVRPCVRRSKTFMSQGLSCVCKYLTGIPSRRTWGLSLAHPRARKGLLAYTRGQHGSRPTRTADMCDDVARWTIENSMRQTTV